jgi:uncharacterized protein
MYILDNQSENRLRAPFRISFFLVGISIVWILSGMIRTALAGTGAQWMMTSISFVVTALLCTMLVYISGRWVDNRPFTGFGFFRSSVWTRELIEGVALTTFVILVIYTIGIYLNWFEITGWRPGIVRPGSWIPSLIGYLIMMMSVAYYEELVFRGYLTLNLFEGFTRKPLYSRLPALVTTLIISAFFALVHVNNPNATWLGVFNILLAGFMLGVPYFITGSLAMPIGIHFAWNFMQGPILGIPVSGIVFRSSLIQTDAVTSKLLTGGTFGLEGGLIGTLGILLIIVLTLLILRKRYSITEIHPALLSQSVLIQK